MPPLRSLECALPFLGPLRAGHARRVANEALWGKVDPYLALMSLEAGVEDPYERALDGWILAHGSGRQGVVEAGCLLSLSPAWAKRALPKLALLKRDRHRGWLVVESERFYLLIGEGGPKAFHKTIPPELFLDKAAHCPEANWPLGDRRELAELCARLCALALHSAGRPWADPRFGLAAVALGLQSAFERDQLSQAARAPDPASGPSASRRGAPRV